MRRKRKARHAFSGKPVPNPLLRAAFVGKSQAISESGAARPGDSQGRDLTHERVGGDQRLARVPSGASNFRFESPAARRPLAWSRTAGERHAAEVDPSGPRPRRLLAGPWARRRFLRKRPEYPVSGTNGSNPSSSSGESSKLRRRSLPARLPCLDRDDGVPLSQRRVQRTPLLLADLSYSPPLNSRETFHKGGTDPGEGQMGLGQVPRRYPQSRGGAGMMFGKCVGDVCWAASFVANGSHTSERSQTVRNP